MITVAQSTLHETTEPLLGALYKEIQDLSKKKPDATLSDGKVKLINRLLEDMRIVLANEADIKYLDVLDSDSLPQYSDVVLILSQYTAAMERFRRSYYIYRPHLSRHEWAIKK